MKFSCRYSFALPIFGLFLAVFLLPAQAEENMEARGKGVAADLCAECHGRDGRGISSDYPSLAGQHAEYIVKQVFNFKTGQRRNDEMAPVLEKLLAVDIRAVAQHFANTKAAKWPSSDHKMLAEGRQLYLNGNPQSGLSACTTCHDINGAGGALMPRIVGQHPVYLAKQLRAFIQKQRQNDRLMHLSLAAMTDREIKAVAAYLGNEE
jgi:cytochrome c553